MTDQDFQPKMAYISASHVWVAENRIARVFAIRKQMANLFTETGLLSQSSLALLCRLLPLFSHSWRLSFKRVQDRLEDLAHWHGALGTEIQTK